MTDDVRACFESEENENELLVQGANLPAVSTQNLNEESKALLDQIIAETDEQKTRDLTQLFNVNQNKKTMVRVNKLSDLLDTITDQALTRFTARPDEISNKELFDGLKIVQDLIERGQKQVSGAGETPLIQINQQTNEVNLGTTASSNLNRDSRERVKAAVLGILNSITDAQSTPVEDENVIVVESQEGVDTDG
jgi:hypothetical protein